MTAYYNENDPFAAEWLRELIKRNLIAQGDVDDRSIAEVRPSDLDGYTQCHFFAGIGGWSYALRLAGWTDSKPVWTGSCPCQPFSAAGKNQGFSDPRHLWPRWERLIRFCRPVVIFGEQVDKALGWLDLVSGDLEGEGYAIGSAIVGAHSVGAPHRRQRIYWVADSLDRGRHDGRGLYRGCTEEGSRDEAAIGSELRIEVEGDSVTQCMAQPKARGREGESLRSDRGSTERIAEGSSDSSLALSDGRHSSPEGLQRGGEQRLQPQDSGLVFVGDSDPEGSQGRGIGRDGSGQLAAREGSVANQLDQSSSEGLALGPRRTLSGGQARSLPERSSDLDPWRAAEWLPCRDRKSRPVEPGTFPLAHGISGRVGRLRGYGNAIVPQLAAEFVQAYLETL